MKLLWYRELNYKPLKYSILVLYSCIFPPKYCAIIILPQFIIIQIIMHEVSIHLHLLHLQLYLLAHFIKVVPPLFHFVLHTVPSVYYDASCH